MLAPPMNAKKNHPCRPSDDTPQPKHSVDSSSDSEDLTYVGPSEDTIFVEPSGPLPTPEWKTNAGTILQQWSGLPLITEPESDVEIVRSEILPHVCDSIIADGNCLFRALSKEITGTQENHRAVRLSIIKFMLEPLNALEFARMLFSTAPDPEVSPLVLITSYIEHTQMCRSAWGTDREIRMAATLFQSDILVFSEFGPECKWSRFRPAFRNRHCTLPATGIKLHLYHTRSLDHYERVVLRLAGLTSVASEPPKCNCGSQGRSHKHSCPMNLKNRC